MASGKGVNGRVIREMVTAWVVTIPATVIVGWVMFKLTRLPGISAYLVVGVIMAGLLTWIVWAMSKAMGADDLAKELPSDAETRQPVAATRADGHGTGE